MVFHPAGGLRASGPFRDFVTKSLRAAADVVLEANQGTADHDAVPAAAPCVLLVAKTRFPGCPHVLGTVLHAVELWEIASAMLLRSTRAV